MSLFWNIFLYWIHNANNFWSSLIWGHNITIKILWRSCLCALRALGWGIQIFWCQIVRFSLWCQIVRFYMAVPNCPFLHDGAKLSAVPNCPFYMTVPNCPGAKLSVFTLRCQIVRFSLRCQIVRGAKLSAVPNCPRCQIVRVPNCPRTPPPGLVKYHTFAAFFLNPSLISESQMLIYFGIRFYIRFKT